MKIGLYTIHASHNVGAMLQAFALTKVLKTLGAEVELVNMYPLWEEVQNHHSTKGSFVHNLMRSVYMLLHPNIKQMEKHFDKFYENMPLSKRYFTQEEYMSSPAQYDIHLVGSDQVWNLQNGYNFSKFYFLDYLPDDAVRISYASSFGTTVDFKGEKEAGRALNKFQNISVREDKAVDFVRSISGKECSHVVDPTLLLHNTEWDEIVSKEQFIKGKYIFFYGVNTDSKTWNILSEAKKQLNIPIVGYPGPLRPQYKFDKFVLDGGPSEFVNLIKNAELVITSSFHGLAFSINYNKNFILVKYGTRMERMNSLISLLKAEEHIADDINDVQRILSKENVLKDLSDNLEIARNASLNWIRKKIFANS